MTVYIILYTFIITPKRVNKLKLDKKKGGLKVRCCNFSAYWVTIFYLLDVWLIIYKKFIQITNYTLNRISAKFNVNNCLFYYPHTCFVPCPLLLNQLNSTKYFKQFPRYNTYCLTCLISAYKSTRLKIVDEHL